MYKRQDLKNVIHVAGTNGKGSTVTFIKDLLVKQGYHVGTFTSPYIIKHNERISVDGKPISDEELLKEIHDYQKKCGKASMIIYDSKKEDKRQCFDGDKAV